LGANGATGALIRINIDLFALGVKGRTGQLIDAIAVIFAFLANVKGLAPGFFKTLGIKSAGFFGNDYGNAFKINRAC
jgi:hypothetical protein